MKTVQSRYTVGLSMYSLRDLFKSGDLHVFDYPKFAKEEFGITHLDVWDGCFTDAERNDDSFYCRLRQRAEEVGSEIFLLMAETLQVPKSEFEKEMQKREFYRMVDKAVLLGAKYLRVFVHSPSGERNIALIKSAEVIWPIAGYAELNHITLVIEPGGDSEYASQGAFLVDLINVLKCRNCKLMPDFGKMIDHDPYGGTEIMMPETAVVSAKTYDFDEWGNPELLDYSELMDSVVESGFDGVVAIEYEGERLSPVEGVLATKRVLERFNG